jgi:hypothetical protein
MAYVKVDQVVVEIGHEASPENTVDVYQQVVEVLTSDYEDDGGPGPAPPTSEQIQPVIIVITT